MNYTVFKGRRVLVTGDTGFKGSWLCEWLLNLGAEVSGFSLPPEPDAPLFDQLRLRDRIAHHDGDIRELDAVQSVLEAEKPEVVMHLAAQSLVRESYVQPKYTFDTNVGGSVNLLEAIRLCPDVKALIFVTTDKCYRNKEWDWGYRENDELGGHDPYSASKAAAEIVFEGYQKSFWAGRSDFGAASARAGNVIGGGDWSKDRIVPDCVRAFMAREDAVVRNPLSVRPWQHVLEPLSGYLLLAQRLLGGDENACGAWNFGPDNEDVRPVRELAFQAAASWGGARVVEKVDPNAPHEAQLLTLSSEKAKRKLDWRARWDFNTAVDKTLSWYKLVAEGVDPQTVTSQQINGYMADGN
ncbi:MAG: CDP-glucose 4,6-dehydratase [Alphaproteobacteria bacterium]|nr:CDP-glucose 4,6-dehydratase [Alphaproteobacteria bacterium]MBF0249715.1 CDP-glucose 4,6-dehydratase [Alphaproteobacteria bacterium]